MTVFPDILLPEVLDYFDLEELLLSAMPVNRFWRWSAIEHPRYWRHISLDENTPSQTCLSVSSLFFLRLERAGAKPVDVRIWMMDPTPVLGVLGRNLYHIRRFTICTLLKHSISLFLSMRDVPAPILEHFDVAFRDESGSEDDIVMIPAVLFALEAPMLTLVAFINCALSSDDALPKWLSTVTTFSYQNHSVSEIVPQLPNVFSAWPRLRDLRLRGPIGLDNPAFRQASTWARLEFLRVDGALVRSFNALPLSDIPRVELTDTDLFTADHIVSIAGSLMQPGPLHVALRAALAFYVGDDSVPIVDVHIVLKGLADADRPRGRWMRGYLPPGAAGLHPRHFINAFQHAPLLERIASLSVALHSWDYLVGAGYLARFPAVETLALTIAHWRWFCAWEGTWRAPARCAATLALPRLRRLVLRYDQDGPPDRRPVLQLADLAGFVAHRLSGVQLPLLLSLEGVEVQGVPEEFSGVFCT